MRTRGAGARIDPRTGETVVRQEPSVKTGATIGRVHVETRVRALVLALGTLIDVPALIVVDLP